MGQFSTHRSIQWFGKLIAGGSGFLGQNALTHVAKGEEEDKELVVLCLIVKAWNHWMTTSNTSISRTSLTTLSIVIFTIVHNGKIGRVGVIAFRTMKVVQDIEEEPVNVTMALTDAVLKTGRVCHASQKMIGGLAHRQLCFSGSINYQVVGIILSMKNFSGSHIRNGLLSKKCISHVLLTVNPLMAALASLSLSQWLDSMTGPPKARPVQYESLYAPSMSFHIQKDQSAGRNIAKNLAQ